MLEYGPDTTLFENFPDRYTAGKGPKISAIFDIMSSGDVPAKGGPFIYS